MALSTLFLVFWVFLQSAASLGWFSVDSRLVAVIGVIFAILAVIEALPRGVVIKLPLRKK